MASIVPTTPPTMTSLGKWTPTKILLDENKIGQIKIRPRYLYLNFRLRNIKTVAANEVEAWPEKKLEWEGSYNTLITSESASTVFGRLLITKDLVRFVIKWVKLTQTITIDKPKLPLLTVDL